MNCLQVEENFSAYLEDTLDYQTLQRFESHLETCATCEREYAQFREAVTASQQLPQIEPSPYFTPRLQQRLAEEQRAPLSFWERLQRIFNAPRWVFSVIIVGLLIMTATFLYHDNWFNKDTRSSNDSVVTPEFGPSSESPSVNTQLLPRRYGGYDSSTQQMRQNYTLKRVSYATVLTGGGL